MRVELCLPLALLFLTNGLPSNAQKSPTERSVVVEAGAPLVVECELRVEQLAEWRLEGRVPPADLRPAAESAPADGWLTARLRAPAARPAHAGVYTCAPPDAPLRHRVRVQLRPLAAPAAPAADTEASAAASEHAAELGEPDLYFERSFDLNCTNPSLPKDTYVWSKNKTEVSKLKELGELRFELLEDGAILRVKPALENDFGDYTCATGAGYQRSWRVWARPRAKLVANTNVVEGQKLKLTCKVLGKPTAGAVTWKYNATAQGPELTLASGARDGRVTLAAADNVTDSVLVLADAARADAGLYSCVPGVAGERATTTLRVKDMYAALWPFLGICAEVFVLCAIILVYEKRRTKPELDDSDTDNHDQ
ncbi:basigin [Plodia interpunctella]|uniref:basigin n=1 Tax=Plodia interpunctella TaxID=58824 RepID=UPI002367FF9A|nr:basigin [Plodia interpunctella]